MELEKSEARLAQLLEREGETHTMFQDVNFIQDTPMQPAHFGDRDGVMLWVRLTSYRSLPLSCIEDLQVTIDGANHTKESLVLFLDNVPYNPTEFGALFDRWWFILDTVQIFVPTGLLTEGPHKVAAKLSTVEPYVTAGRCTFHYSDACELTLVKD